MQAEVLVEDLHYLELQSVFQKSSSTDEEVLQMIHNTAKPIADAWVKKRREEFEASNTTILEHVAKLFDSLIDPYNATVKRLAGM